jgi:hypothetical protein
VIVDDSLETPTKGHDMDMHHHGQPEKPNFHGMTLVGERRAYLSHLPMFMVPHEYQAIFEVTLSKAGSDPFADYVRDTHENPPGSAARPDTSSRMYGFEPVIDFQDNDPLTDLFVLTDLVSADQQSPPKRNAFTGNIYRGHFEDFHVHEKAGPAILRNVVATVTNAVVFRKFDEGAAPLPQLEYLLFGSAEDLYLAHTITRPPDFDQILSVQARDLTMTDGELGRGVPVIFPGRANSENDKLGAGETVTGRIGGADVDLTLGAQHYFETDDLQRGMEG